MKEERQSQVSLLQVPKTEREELFLCVFIIIIVFLVLLI